MSGGKASSELEQRVAGALRRSAPRPASDLLSRTLRAIVNTPQRNLGRAPAARRTWALALGATAGVGILIGLFISSSISRPAAPATGSASAFASNTAGPSNVPFDWQEPAAYSFTYEWCGGESNLAGTWHVSVADGRVAEFARVSGGPPPIAEPRVPTLGDMLSHARAAQAGANPYLIFPQLRRSPEASEPPNVSVSFDPGDGHPLEIRIDWLPAAIDDEECYRIADYQPTRLASPTPAEPGWEAFDLGPAFGGGDTSVAAAYAGQSRIVVVGGAPAADPSVGQVPVAWYSDDGRTWHASKIDAEGTTGSTNEMDVLFTAGDRLYAFASAQDASSGAMSALFESSDGGAVWTRVTDAIEPTGGHVRDVAAGGPGYVAVGVAARGLGVGAGSVVWTSGDGVSWRPVAQGDGTGVIAKGSLDAVAEHAGTLVAVGSNLASQGESESVWTSSDGETWIEHNAPPDMHVTDITWAHGAWIAAGTGHSGTPSLGDVPTIWRSTDDGRSWVRIHLDPVGGVRSAWRVTAREDGTLIAIGDAEDHAVAWTSASGKEWKATVLPLGSRTDAAAWAVIAYKRGFVVGGSGQNASNESEPMVWLSH